MVTYFASLWAMLFIALYYFNYFNKTVNLRKLNDFKILNIFYAKGKGQFLIKCVFSFS